MSKLIFKNNATSTLAGSIQAAAVQAQLAVGTGALFAHPAPGQYFVGTFTDAATGLLNEIVWVTAVNGDTITMVRGQEGTQPQPWAANDTFAELWTAGQAGAMLQQGDAQSQGTNFGPDTGIANAYRVTLNPPLTAPVQGMPIRWVPNATNTGPSTLDPGSGAAAILNAQGLPLTGGEIKQGMVNEAYWNGTSYNLLEPSVFGVPTGAMFPFAQPTAPAGYLRCDGQAVDRNTYSALFAVIGVTYGAGNGTTTFTLPDMRGRVAAHQDGGVGRLTNATMTPDGNTIGATGGNQTESAGVSASGSWRGATDPFSLGVSTTSDPIPLSGSANTGSGGSFNIVLPGTQVNTRGATDAGAQVGVSVSGSVSGSTAIQTNVQPTMVLTYIIKV